MIEEAKRLRSRPTMELFGHQAVFQDPPIRFSASNAYNRLSHDDFAYRIGMIRLENTRLPHVGADRSASQHAHCNSIRLTVLSLSPLTLRDTRNGGSGVRLKQTRFGP
jgi:hypothetical protein